MEITINQQSHQLKEASSVEQMLAAVCTPAPKGIAVAVNQNIIPKSQWAGHLLNPGDQVILIKATQGG